MSHGDAIHYPEQLTDRGGIPLDIGSNLAFEEQQQQQQQQEQQQQQQEDETEQKEPMFHTGGGWDENRTETTTIDTQEELQQEGESTESWDCCLQLLPIDTDDLVRPSRVGPDRHARTLYDRPRRVAVCHNISGHYHLLGGLEAGPRNSWSSTPLTRQDSGAAPLASVLLVKYYDAHDRLGVFHGHEGAHLGDLPLQLDPESQFTDLCVSNRYQTVYLADQVNSRVYAVNLAGQLRPPIIKRVSAPQAIGADDRHSLLFVCQRRKVRVFQLGGRRRYLRSLKSAAFRNLTSASARDGRLWLADNHADRLHVYAVRDGELDLLHTITLQNPLCVSLDASGSAFVTSGEPLHCVTVYGPDGCEVGSFGGWGSKQNKMKLPAGICAYQLSHLVDKRMVLVCCFAEHSFRMYSFKSADTMVI